MAPLRAFSFIVCLAMAYSQNPAGSAGFDPNLDYAKEVHELRYTMQTLLTQNMALTAQVNAIQNTLIKQQTMSADEICQILEAERRKGN